MNDIAHDDPFASLPEPERDLWKACTMIRNAPLGQHHFILDGRAYAIGQHIAAGRLDATTARTALLEAAQPLIEAKSCHCSSEKVAKAIDTGFATALAAVAAHDHNLNRARQIASLHQQVYVEPAADPAGGWYDLYDDSVEAGNNQVVDTLPEQVLLALADPIGIPVYDRRTGQRWTTGAAGDGRG